MMLADFIHEVKQMIYLSHLAKHTSEAYYSETKFLPV